MLSRLPDFVRIVRGFFVTEKKVALPREDVIKKLVDSHPSRLPPGQLGLKNVNVARYRVPFCKLSDHTYIPKINGPTSVKC